MKERRDAYKKTLERNVPEETSITRKREYVYEM